MSQQPPERPPEGWPPPPQQPTQPLPGWGQQPPQGQPPQWGPPGQQRPPGQPKPRRPWYLRWWAITLAVLAVLFIIGAVFGEEPTQTTSQTPATTLAPPTAPITTQAPPQTNAPTTAKVTTTTKPRPITYRSISARQWALIAKNPDAHVGEHYVVHGQVTQFDSATGTDTFRADVDGVVHRPSYGFVDYPTNTILTGDEQDFENLVANDLFKANVTVLGSQSYDTQIGGNTTVPLLEVDSIRRTGSTD